VNVPWQGFLAPTIGAAITRPIDAKRAKTTKDLKVMIRFVYRAKGLLQRFPGDSRVKDDNEGAPGSTDVVWNRKEGRKREKREKREERELGSKNPC